MDMRIAVFMGFPAPDKLELTIFGSNSSTPFIEFLAYPGPCGPQGILSGEGQGDEEGSRQRFSDTP
ncbi:unnamed protein product [marine sediment metagenome]|uniref:Uncharacterized protein n=1 Tax=marine sediment metagenome TaxID=412755 RepID=X1MAI2_9ZZZZ